MLRLGRTRSQAALHCSFERRDSRRIRRDRPSVGQQQQRMARLRGEGGGKHRDKRAPIRPHRDCRKTTPSLHAPAAAQCFHSASLLPAIPLGRIRRALLALALLLLSLAAHAYLPPKRGSSTRDSRCHPTNQRRSDCAARLCLTRVTSSVSHWLACSMSLSRSTFAGALGQ